MNIQKLLDLNDSWGQIEDVKRARLTLAILKEICNTALSGENAVYLRIATYSNSSLVIIGDHVYEYYHTPIDTILAIITGFVKDNSFIWQEEKEYYIISW